MRPPRPSTRLFHTRRRQVPSSRPEPPPRTRFIRFSYRRPPPWQHSMSCEPSPVTELNQNTSKWREIRNKTLPLTPIHPYHSQQLPEVPTLAHNMHPVLRGDGVYPLEAPWTQTRTRPSSNFRRRIPAYYADSLRKIVPPDRIDWNAIPSYIPAATDKTLHELAAATPGVKYCSSTSSISPAVAALYHLLSNFRGTQLRGGLSKRVEELPAYFSKMHRRPVAVMVSEVGNGVCSVNAHSGDSSGPSILRDLGHSMERMLTTGPGEFAERYVRRDGTNTVVDGPCGAEEQFYHYSVASRFLLRAQIDCRNAETGEVFDVKTRAVAPIRYDLENYAAFRNHRLRFLRGKSDSYEREFYDMVRTVFLKYALQLRIGRMHGALVAYHNTTELLGLEYIPLKEIESYVFGSERWADVAFGTAVSLLEDVLDVVRPAMRTKNGESLKIVLCTEWSRLQMLVFVQRVVPQIEEDQFGATAFLKAGMVSNTPDEARSRRDLSGRGQWHFDSYLHDGIGGIAVVGSHKRLEELGGERVEEEEGSAPVRRQKIGVEMYNYGNFDCGWLTRERFRVWQLDVAPMVNNVLAPRHCVEVGDGDCFRLRYQLKEVEKVRKEHLAKFVTSLGRIYSG